MKSKITESSFHPTRQQYHLDSWTGKAPRQRWFDSHQEMLEAFDRVNPLEIACVQCGESVEVPPSIYDRTVVYHCAGCAEVCTQYGCTH